MSADERQRRASALGGLRSAAKLTPEERSERARAAINVRWARENQRREAEGLAPTKKYTPELTAEELEPYLEEVDRRWPDREWPTREARRRQAVLLARIDVAEAASGALRRNGDEK